MAKYKFSYTATVSVRVTGTVEADSQLGACNKVAYGEVDEWECEDTDTGRPEVSGMRGVDVEETSDG